MGKNSNSNQLWMMAKAMASAAKSDKALRWFIGKFHKGEDVPRGTFSGWRKSGVVGEEYRDAVIKAFSRFYQLLIERHVSTTFSGSSPVLARYAIFIENSQVFTMADVVLSRGNVYFVDRASNTLVAPLLGVETTFAELGITDHLAVERRLSQDAPPLDSTK